MLISSLYGRKYFILFIVVIGSSSACILARDIGPDKDILFA